MKEWKSQGHSGSKNANRLPTLKGRVCGARRVSVFYEFGAAGLIYCAEHSSSSLPRETKRGFLHTLRRLDQFSRPFSLVEVQGQTRESKDAGTHLDGKHFADTMERIATCGAFFPPLLGLQLRCEAQLVLSADGEHAADVDIRLSVRPLFDEPLPADAKAALAGYRELAGRGWRMAALQLVGPWALASGIHRMRFEGAITVPADPPAFVS
jgi:hypothetical protein